MNCNGCGMELKNESQTHMRGGITICNNCGLDIDTGKRPEELEKEGLEEAIQMKKKEICPMTGKSHVWHPGMYGKFCGMCGVRRDKV